MMYLPSPAATGEPAARVRAARVSARSVVPQLNALEWRVLFLARREADAGVRIAPVDPGPFGRLFRAITGIGQTPRLADERLEKIRQFVAHTRRRERAAEVAGADLIGLGFSEPELRGLAMLAVVDA